MSLTGNPNTDAMVSPAMSLVWAIRENNGDSITERFMEAAQHTGGDLYRAACGLALTLAAMVPDDLTAPELLAWASADRSTYLQLRRAGMGATEATQAAAASLEDIDADVVPLRRGR